MNYLLIVYLCSAVDGQCVIPNSDPYLYPKIQDSHSSCVKYGLGDSFDLLYGEKYFTPETINQMKLYPKFTCEKIEDKGEIVPEGNPA